MHYYDLFQLHVAARKCLHYFPLNQCHLEGKHDSWAQSCFIRDPKRGERGFQIVPPL